jgi:hypothetical protein
LHIGCPSLIRRLTGKAPCARDTQGTFAHQREDGGDLRPGDFILDMRQHPCQATHKREPPDCTGGSHNPRLL